jgi:hypothetical protein
MVDVIVSRPVTLAGDLAARSTAPLAPAGSTWDATMGSVR